VINALNSNSRRSLFGDPEYSQQKQERQLKQEAYTTGKNSGESVSVLNIAMSPINATYYKVIITLEVQSDGVTAPIDVLSSVSNIISSYQGFIDNGFLIVSTEYTIDSSSSSSTTSTTAPTAEVEDNSKKGTNIAVIIAPIVVIVVVLGVAIIAGVYFYRKRNRGQNNIFNNRRNNTTNNGLSSSNDVPAPRSRKKKGNIWLDMESLPTNDL